MTNEDPIFVVSRNLADRVVALMAVGFFVFVAWAGLRGAKLEMLNAMGWWVLPVLALGGYQLLRLARHMVFSGWEARFFPDRVVVKSGRQEAEHFYRDVSRFFVTDSAVSIEFRDNGNIQVPFDDGHDAMDLIQQCVGHEIPGYRKRTLSITGAE